MVCFKTRISFLTFNYNSSIKFGPMTVELKVPKTKSSGAIEAVGPKPVDLKDILDVDPLLQGQALLAANKKRKKQQKRAGKTLFVWNKFIHE